MTPPIKRLSDEETVMWRLEADPWFQSSFGALSVLDGPTDHRYLAARLLAAVERIPALRQRIVERAPENPVHETDRDFEIDHHLRRVRLVDPDDPRSLLDLAARLVADPLDRSRPLWRFTVVEGLPGGASAVLTKFHHSLTDGEGGVQLALEYLDLEPTLQTTAPLDELRRRVEDLVRDEAPSSATPAVSTAARQSVARQLGRARGVLGEAAMYLADPARVGEQANAALANLRRLADQMPDEESSPLWSERSRRRHLAHVHLDLDSALAAAREHEATLNDLLLTAVSEAASRYHDSAGAELPRLQASFVVSHRDDSTGVGNAFAPLPVELPGRGVGLTERFAVIRDRTTAAKTSSSGAWELQQALAGPARFVPTTALTALARRQASRIDVATSNLRSVPVPIYVGGARVLYNVPIGPVAGTACNITLMSYEGRADLGIHLDPSAIAEPDAFVDALEAVFGELGVASAVSRDGPDQA